MSKHTKGPWVVANNGKQGKKSATFRIWRTDPNQLQGDDFKNIGYECIAPHVAGEANARLISAAPELLQALKVAQLWLDVDGRYDMQGINAAISKAEGQ